MLYHEGFTLAGKNTEEYSVVFGGKEAHLVSPLFNLRIEDVETILWPGTYLSYLIVSLEMRNGDNIKVFAYHSQGAEGFA